MLLTEHLDDGRPDLESRSQGRYNPPVPLFGAMRSELLFLSKISSFVSSSLSLTFIVRCLLTTGSSTISNQLEAGSIMVRAMKSICKPSLPLRVYGPMRSTHKASQGILITVFAGRCPYLSFRFLFVWQVLQDFVIDRMVVRIPFQYIAALIVSSTGVSRVLEIVVVPHHRTPLEWLGYDQPSFFANTFCAFNELDFQSFINDKPIGAAPQGHFFVGGGGGVWAKKFVTLRGLQYGFPRRKKSSASRQYCKLIESGVIGGVSTHKCECPEVMLKLGRRGEQIKLLHFIPRFHSNLRGHAKKPPMTQVFGLRGILEKECQVHALYGPSPSAPPDMSRWQ